MAVTLGGNTITVAGDFPKVGQSAPPFTLTNANLQDVSLADYAGKKKVLNIVPSLDTPTCQASARKFNEAANKLANTVVFAISADLPFAQSRFCGAEGLNNVHTLSTFRHRDFHRDYGVSIESGPIQGLTARAVVILDEHDRVIYTQLVGEIKEEPDYAAALAALQH